MKGERMSDRRFCQIVFWLKLCSAILLFIAAVWLCIYASVYLPQKIGTRASGAGAIFAIFGAGVAVAVVIALTLLISAGVIILLVCAVIFIAKERSHSPFNEGSNNHPKRYLGFRIAADIVLSLSSVIVLFFSISFGVGALISSLFTAFSIVLVVVAEIMQGMNLRRKNTDKDE